MKKITNKTVSNKTIFFTGILLLVNIIISAFILNSIDFINNYVPVMINILLILLVIFIVTALYKTFNNEIKYTIPTVISFIIFNVIFIFIIFGHSWINKVLNKVSDNQEVYSSVIIVKSDSELNSVEDLVNKKIGLSEDNNDYENHVIGYNYLSENDKLDNTFYKYVDYLIAINDLLSGKIDSLIISSNYVNIYEEYYEKLGETTKVIAGPLQDIVSLEQAEPIKAKESFTVLVIGSDQLTGDFNADVLILMTINTKTNKVVMVDVVRDTYVYNKALNKNDKIAHSGWNGVDNVVDSVSTLFDVEIDYYVKVNFDALVDVVDAMGGITFEVPYKYLVNGYNKDYYYVEPGTKLLNGKEVLWLARTRKLAGTNLLSRGMRQMEIIEKIISQTNSKDLINNFLPLFDSLGENIKTNMTKEDLYYYIQKYISIKGDLAYSLNTLEGTDSSYYHEYLNEDLYTYIYDEDSLKELREKLLLNLK